MRKHLFRATVAALSFTSFSFFFMFHGLCAAAPINSNTIRISPALSNIKLAPNETSTSIMMEVSNLTLAPLTLNLSTQDFSASPNQSDIVSFYGTGYNPYTNPHGLQMAVSLNPTKITLGPGASQKVDVSLDNLTRLAAGGHYGAILFSPTAAASGGANTTKVSISSAAASLIFLQTATGGTQSLSLLSFSARSFVFSMPQTSYVAFKNTGNTQTTPQGQLTLYGPGNKLVSTTVLNAGSGLVLPDSSRPYTVSLPPMHAHVAWAGIFRLQLQYRSTPQGGLTTINKRFFYINPWALCFGVMLLLALFPLLRRKGRSLFKVFLRVTYLRRPKVAPAPPPVKPKKPRPLIQG